jgi:polysaccharide biosynthesis/export protein
MRAARICRFSILLVLGVCLAASGCHHLGHRPQKYVPDVPRESNKVVTGEYIIQPPDILIIDLVRAVPLPPYKIKAQDLLFIHVRGTPPEDPIKGVYRVEPEGIIRFGPAYGSMPIVDLTIDEAIKESEKFLKKAGLKDPQTSISLEETRGTQLIRGEHLVRPDGSVNLGLYGRVLVAGMTQESAKAAIEEQLSKYFLKPTISLDIGGFNSSVYYVIFDGGGNGEQVIRLPYTGSETVLDAIGQVSGLPAVASKNRAWLARPKPNDAEEEILPIDWCGITQRGKTMTNYQIYPGDRVYVAAQPMVKVDTFLAKTLAPVERVLGITLLGSSTVRSFRVNNNGNNFGN